ncbi:MAG TPA: pitrilysin family protein [Saprospiraceae bacterium]|mgnify:CR=1 FL=1|nr:pitrilysin family protein [Saprospiraceae bacterium]HPI06264.1 pitrilysin family protein [Saprospiraceae bacterium]
MQRVLAFTLSLLFLGTVSNISAQDYPVYDPNSIDVPFTKFTLPNGLRLIVHEDHKAPIVAVNIWYHVGSKNEKPGKSGFAHLFEHLMFNGSENYNTDYFQALEAIGATDLNGTTSEDRTNYFQNVPVGALDQVLWLESDRMGHLLGAIDQAKLDEQRGVVQNEKRQGENEPYALGYDIIQKEMFPPYHPYGHTVIGEMSDLNAASLQDVQEWFKAYYGAANAVLVIAGDITPEVAYQKALNNFGNIPAGPTIARPSVNIPRRFGNTRGEYQDRVPQSQIIITWNIPQWGTQEIVWLDLLSDVLSSGKNSRLYKKLVYEKQICTSIYAGINPSEIAGNFGITANVKPGKTVEEVENTINEVMDEFLASGPTEEEVKRVKAAYFANTLKGLERIGGFGGKSDLLAMNEVYGGSPDYYKKLLRWYNETTAKNIHEAGKKWLSDGRFTLVCNPFPEYTVTGSEVDRSKAPEVDKKVNAQFPDLQRATLKNGMKVVLARRAESPTVVASMMFDAGYCSDKFGGKLGLASIAMRMLTEGTKTLNSLQINEKLQLLGANLNASSDLDYSYVTLSALKQSLDPSLDLMADVVLRPSFPETDFKRLQDQQVNQIANEKKQPQSMVMRVMPELLYGKDHPYAMPMSGSGETDIVKTLTVSDVQGFYQRWLRPNNATIVVSGDISMPELVEKLEKRFGTWSKGEVPKKLIPEVKNTDASNKIFLIDRPESEQTMIVSGYLTKPYGQMDEAAIEQMNNVLGGDFTSRINLNIREDKHWSYGAGSTVQNTRGQRPYLVYTSVQTDKTKESVQEIIKEVNSFVGDKQMTQKEFDKTKQNTVLGMAGMWETNGAVNASVRSIIKYGLKDDYWKTYSDRVQKLGLQDVQNVAKSIVQPNQLGWFMSADAEKTLPGLQQLGMEVIQINADGKVVSKKVKP